MNEKTRLNFLLALLGFFLVLSLLVLRPFAYALILAAVFAVIFQPLYKKILVRVYRQKWLAAGLTIIILIIFILLPLTFLIFQIFQEAQGLYISLVNGLGDRNWLDFWPDLDQKLRTSSPLLSNFSLDLDQYLENILKFIVQNLGTVFSNLAKILVSLFIFLITFFFLLKDGENLKQKIIHLSPLSKDDDEIIIKKIKLAINSIIKGSLFIAVLQGISSSIGFIIFGVPNPIIWGTTATVGALIPGVGTTIILTPAIIYLYLTGQTINALGLLIWGVLAVGLIDNFLGPRFISKGVGLHPLLVLLSVLGGLSLFGPAGFVLGPLIVTLSIVLLDIYINNVKQSR